MKTPLADQVVVVLGASSGIGRATAARRREAGSQGRRGRPERGSAGRGGQEVEAAGSEGIAVVTDTTSEADLEALCARRRRAVRPDRHVRRLGDGDGLRRGRAARRGGAPAGHGRQLPPVERLPTGRRSLTSSARAGPSSTSTRDSPTEESRSRPPTAPRRRQERASSVSARTEQGEARDGSRHQPDPPWRDQHAAVRSRAPEARPSSRSPCRRSISRRSSPRRSSIAASGPSGSCR